MSIRISKAGIQDTIQDLGRYGYSKWGINPSGVMDRYAAQVANALVGNELTEGVIELHFPAGKFEFTETQLIAITGGDFHAKLNNEEIPCWKPIIVPKGSVLHFTHRVWGSRAYVAVHGGFDLPTWLKSYSTNLKAAVGGLDGHALEKGNDIKIRKGNIIPSKISKGQTFRWGASRAQVYHENHILYFIQGPEWNWLSPESQHALETATFIIDRRSDRMAYYLDNENLRCELDRELLSTGVSFGTIQLLPSGKLVILMADHQTTGGYPRIGQIIKAHLPKLSQLAPTQNFRLKSISLGQAEKMLFSLQRDVHILKNSCDQKLNELLYDQD